MIEDAHELLSQLVDTTVHTISDRKPNKIVAIERDQVFVDVGKGAQPVPIAWVQAGLDQLLAKGEVRVDVPTLGYRSSFIGAVLASMPDVIAETKPQRVRLRS